MAVKISSGRGDRTARIINSLDLSPSKRVLAPAASTPHMRPPTSRGANPARLPLPLLQQHHRYTTTLSNRGHHLCPSLPSILRVSITSCRSAPSPAVCPDRRSSASSTPAPPAFARIDLRPLHLLPSSCAPHLMEHARLLATSLLP